MSTIHRFRPTFLISVVVVAFGLVAPGAVNAQEEVVAEELDLAAREHVPVLAPAAPSWDETSGYGAVEVSRAAIGHEAVVSEDTLSGHEASAALGLSWDELSGYGAVEANRAANAMPIAGPCYLGTALASGQRTESAHLATVLLPGAGEVSAALAAC